MNQNPEQLARDNIDKQLLICGWIIQDKKQINLNAGVAVVIREYQAETGPPNLPNTCRDNTNKAPEVA